MHNESRVLSVVEAEKVFRPVDVAADEGLILVARDPIPGRLRFAPRRFMEYLKQHCRPPTNDCADNVFLLDCTHFVCHALSRGGVFVKLPSVSCASAMCVRVNELAASFAAAVPAYGNVKHIGSHAETQSGDFCFIPKWFGLSKEHAMVLASTATPLGAKVFAHTNARCGDQVEFEGAECVYYRIDEAVT